MSDKIKDDFTNYIPIKSYNPFICRFLYFDIRENYLADSIFIQHKMRVKFGPEFAKSGEKYVLVHCKIKKCDKEKFLQSMEELQNKALLLGYNDYKEFCKEKMKEFLEGVNKNKM